jgi:hypothetical protein
MLEYRALTAPALALVAALFLWNVFPFPDPGATAMTVWLYTARMNVFLTLRCIWIGVLFCLPLFYLVIPALSLVICFAPGRRKSSGSGSLPPYPDARERRVPFVVLGEYHCDKYGHPLPLMERSNHPDYFIIPEEGLFTGLIVFGATGTGKTASALMPTVDQLFGYRSQDPARRIGGLALEVKGNFCPKVKRVLEKYSRADDYIEIGPDSDYVYNPLHSDADPTEIAYALVSFFKMLHGGSDKDARFWDESAEALISFLVLIHRLRFGYVTLFDLYATANNLDLLDDYVKEVEDLLERRFVVIPKAIYHAAGPKVLKELQKRSWVDADLPDYLKTRAEASLERFLNKHEIPFAIEEDLLPNHEELTQQLEAAKLYYAKIKNADPRTLANIAAGIENRLQVFSINKKAKRIFCPPKGAYDPAMNADGHLGKPLPPLRDLIETSAVLAVKFPVAESSVLARIIGTLLKIDWERAALNRISRMEQSPGRHFRPLAMLIDEAHLLATFGGSKPFGDESFLNLSREAKVIPVVACQSINSLKDTIGEGWQTFSSAFQTTVWLRQKSTESAREASAAAGRVDMIRNHFTASESSSRSRVGLWGDRAISDDPSIGLSRTYDVVRDHLIEPKSFLELPRGVALVLANDGRRQLPPTFVYLKEWGKDPQRSWFAK